MGKEFAVNKKMNKKWMALLTVSLCLVSRTVWGDEIVRSIDWEALASASALSSGTVVSAPDGVNEPSLRVDHQGTGSGDVRAPHPRSPEDQLCTLCAQRACTVRGRGSRQLL